MLILPTFAIPQELSRCGRALNMAAQGTFEGALRPDSCPITSRLVQWIQLQKPGATFSQTVAFLRENPTWPLNEKFQVQAEENIDGNETVLELCQWFDKNPPLTPKGHIFYARALIKLGKVNAAKPIIRKGWTISNFEGKELKLFLQEFKRYLTPEDHQKRMHRLLMNENISAANAMLPLLNNPFQALAKARITLIQKANNVDAQLALVPKELIKDPGLIYDRIKWCRQKELYPLMVSLIQGIAQPQDDKDLWWKERNLLTRHLMDNKQYEKAYHIIKAHGYTSGENFAHGEWLAGWIALQMLKKPDVALKHFQTMYEKVKSPISMARATYWASRAAKAIGQTEEAQTWLTIAKAYPGTFYGQIALRGGLTDPLPPLHSRRPKIDGLVRQKFEKREMVQAIRLLAAVGAKHLIEPFGLKLSQEITDHAEQILFIEMAAKDFGPYYGVLTAKKLPLKNVPLIEAAFPILPRHYHKVAHAANAALVHSIIRQESRFKPDAISPANAQGLMQLMPKTALQVAQKMKIRLGSLCDPNVNVPLGCAHLCELREKYKSTTDVMGSLILVIAAYNAGAPAVESWIQKYGDPRKQGIDLIDWIEKIPFGETRNYVQRVLENFGYYLQRLGQ